jgi:hypothetical protein
MKQKLGRSGQIIELNVFSLHMIYGYINFFNTSIDYISNGNSIEKRCDPPALPAPHIMNDSKI